MMRIVAATGNQNKLRELTVVGARFGVEVVSPKQIAEEKSLDSGPPEVEETGTTYYENAKLKADAFYSWCGEPCLGDDSGLEVDALNGEPGLHSARFLGEDMSYEFRMNHISSHIKDLEGAGVPVSRDARYRCCLVFQDGNKERVTESSIEGSILDEFRGEGGFGYDRIFLIKELGKTFAEIDFSVTCTKGFRAVAAEKLFAELISK